jgi:hypothetical protein
MEGGMTRERAIAELGALFATLIVIVYMALRLYQRWMR